jgi:sigma-B regulation protein RsbU (phosphoserine phosphatase)
MIPKGSVSADFVEIFTADDHLFVVVGDVPGGGLESAFVARFLANLAKTAIETASSHDLARAIEDIDHRISGNDNLSLAYFSHVTIQLADFDGRAQTLTICNGGHPYPVRYAARFGQCDRIPVGGGLLSPLLSRRLDWTRRARRVELEPGDVIVLITDGLLDSGHWDSRPYEYRFMDVVKRNARETARTIGEAIFADWVRYPRAGGLPDDVTVVVIAVQPEAIEPREAGH